MQPRDGIYIGMGNKEITFKSENPEARRSSTFRPARPQGVSYC
jgi:5-keto 4-deoxyuronate isomerase